MGPYDDEIHDSHRVKLVNQIASHVPSGEKVEPGFWAFIWLSSIDRLESFAAEFDKSHPHSRRTHYAVPTCTKALKLWTARDRASQDLKAGEEANDKPTSVEAEMIERPRERKQSIDRGRSRSRSPSKIPRLGTSQRATVLPASSPSPSTPQMIESPKGPLSWRGEAVQAKKFRRSATLPDKCRKRDNDTCLITRGGDCVDVCHIYPFSLATKMGSTTHRSFWDILSFYWSKDQIRGWESIVLGSSRTETLPNVLCLARTVHGLWGMGRFALKPISLSSDKTSLTVEFYWLRNYDYEFRRLDLPPCLQENVDSTSRGTRLVDCPTKICLESGDKLVFTTEDPETLPLPSMELLELQWILNRLVSLSGAADVPDDVLDPDAPYDLG
ncbi:hypothetical protein BJX64DRAFT_38545 [Aspergillus heterothallicus]